MTGNPRRGGAPVPLTRLQPSSGRADAVHDRFLGGQRRGARSSSPTCTPRWPPPPGRVSGYLLGLACGLAATPWLARRFGTAARLPGGAGRLQLASSACARGAHRGPAHRRPGGAGAGSARRWCRWRWACCWAGTGGRGACRPAPASAVRRPGARPGPRRPADQRVRLAFGVPDQPAGRDRRLAGRSAAGRRGLAGGGDRGARLDLPGLLLLGAGLALATYGASQGPGRGWLSAAVRARLAGRAGADRRLPALGTRLAGRAPARPPAVNLSLLGSPRRAVTLAPGLRGQRGAVRRAVPGPGVPAGHPAPHGQPSPGWCCCRRASSWAWPAGWAAAGRARPGPARHHRLGSVVGGLALLAASTLGMLLLGPATPVWLSAALLLRARRGARADRPAAGHGAGRGSAPELRCRTPTHCSASPNGCPVRSASHCWRRIYAPRVRITGSAGRGLPRLRAGAGRGLRALARWPRRLGLPGVRATMGTAAE